LAGFGSGKSILQCFLHSLAHALVGQLRELTSQCMRLIVLDIENSNILYPPFLLFNIPSSVSASFERDNVCAFKT
jgi:hypothetical protein